VVADRLPAFPAWLPRETVLSVLHPAMHLTRTPNTKEHLRRQEASFPGTRRQSSALGAGCAVNEQLSTVGDLGFRFRRLPPGEPPPKHERDSKSRSDQSNTELLVTVGDP
jgi:hypothetical protein